MSICTPKIALVGFNRQTAETFARLGLNIVSHIYANDLEKNRICAGDNLLNFHRWKNYSAINAPHPVNMHSVKNQVRQEAFREFVRCTDRWDWSKELAHGWNDYEHLFSLAFDHACHWLGESDPDIVLYSNVPHQGVAIVQYYVAKALGKKTLVYMLSPFGANSWLMEDWKDLGVFSTSVEGAETTVDISPPQKPPFYMDTVRTNKTRIFRNIGHRLRGRLLMGFGLTGPGQAGKQRFHRNMGRWQRAVEDTAYLRNSRHIFSDMPTQEEYVYFPLHLQPEMTTDVLGGEFADQLNALEFLREKLPDNLPIYVKENPKQTGRMRGDAFFRRLEKLENMKFIPRECPSFELIHKARAVATISGTAGWEALRMGKPAIAFGHSFWNHLPGAFRAHDELSWQEVAEFKFDPDLLQQSVNRLSRHLHPGFSDLYYAKQVGLFDIEENARQLSVGLARHSLLSG